MFSTTGQQISELIGCDNQQMFEAACPHFGSKVNVAQHLEENRNTYKKDGNKPVLMD